MRASAIVALAHRDLVLADAITVALLERDPQDIEALMIRSRVRRDLGDFDTALALALKASKLAKRQVDRYRASLLVAQALASDGRRFESQLWLRWAVDLAPDERMAAVAARDFRYVRSRNPLSIELAFDVGPSSNVNNGSSAEVITLYGIPGWSLSGDALALSGTRIAAGAGLTWRVQANERRRTQATLAFSHQTHILSSEARLQAPNAEARDFDSTTVQAGVRQILNFGHGRGLWTWEVSAGRNWYGRDPLSDFVSLGLDRTLAFGKVGNLTIAGELGYQRYIDGSGVTATTLGLSGTYAHRLETGGRLTLGLGVEDSMSDETNIDFTAYRLDAAWRLGKPLAGASVTLSAGVELKDYPFSIYTPIPGAREDLSRSVSAEFLFSKAQIWGFAPTVTARYNQRSSNADRYDTETFSVELGIQSVF